MISDAFEPPVPVMMPPAEKPAFLINLM